MTDLIRNGVLRCLLGGLVFLAAAGTGRANDLRVENVHFVSRPGASGELRVVFDLSWKNAWHNDRNHDAAWIFLKFVFDGRGYAHVTLAPDGHRIVETAGREAPPARIEVAGERTGFFIYPGRAGCAVLSK